MSDDAEIEQELLIAHEGLREAVREWADEIGLEDLEPDARDALVRVFRDGWSMCMARTMRPSRDLAMLLLQMVALSRQQGDGFKVVLGGPALEAIKGLCHEIVGKPEGWQLDDVVEMVRIDPDAPPEDLPEEAREAFEKIKKSLEDTEGEE